MVPSLAISRNAPLPPSLYLSLCLIPPPPFFYRLFLAPRSLLPPLSLSRFSPLFIFRFSFSFSFFPFPLFFPPRCVFSPPLFLSGARTLEKRKMVTREDTGGRGTWIRFNESTRGIQSPSPILPPVARTAPAEKRFRFIKNGGRATPSKNDRLWDSQQLCFPF